MTDAISETKESDEALECSECNTKVSANATVCPKCGTKFDE